MLGVLASYSITVKELKLLFGAMKAHNGKWVCFIVVVVVIFLVVRQRESIFLHFIHYCTFSVLSSPCSLLKLSIPKLKGQNDKLLI